jgi:Domain of unknown function (DUF4430)
VSVKLLCALLAVAASLAGCGGEAAEGDQGSASLWVTRDRGSRVLATSRVPAGVSALEALRRETDVETRYGGRFVQSIDGLAGSASSQRDWFFFVNGLEADRGAAEVRLHRGDVLWWDYRSWRGRLRDPVVVGAFPEPFLHGWAGRRRPAAVRHEGAALARVGHALGRVVHARSVAPLRTPVPEAWNVLVVRVGASRRFTATFRTPGASPDGAVRFELVSPRPVEDGLRLARRPELVRYRYEGMP